jgi:tRNA A37 methylthiotransferase MiaB
VAKSRLSWSLACVLVKVVLLGQNVNSYHDRSGQEGQSSSQGYEAAEGFSNMFRSRDGPGPRFADLLDQVSQVDPDMRIRYDYTFFACGVQG